LAACRGVLGIDPLPERARGADAGTEAEAGAVDAGRDVDRAWSRWGVSPDGPASDQFTTDDDVAFDAVTGLSWQRNAPPRATFAAAEAACAALSLGGRAGWRLPTRIELASITDYRRQNPALDPAVFLGTPNAPHWTASPYAQNPANVWTCDFRDGTYLDGARTQTLAYRCVHD
jgi:hypothetical protein